MVTRIYTAPLALLLLTGACVEPSSETDSSSDATTGDTASSTTTATTGENPTTGEATTTTGVTDDGLTTGESSDSTTGEDPTGDSTTGEDPTGEDTTTGADPDLTAACQAYCDLFTACGFQENSTTCTLGCVEGLAGADAMCTASVIDMAACGAGLECEQLFDLDNEDGPCAMQAAATEEACEETQGGCIANNFEDEGVGCGLFLTCDDQPLKIMSCDDQTCVCTVGDETVGECPAEAICMNVDDLEEKAATCCDF